MLSEAINYPRTGENYERTLAIGTVLTIFGFLLIPVLPVLGYLLAVLRRTAKGEVDAPPVFEDWETLFVDGIKVFVVGFVYSIIPAIVLTVFAGGAALAIASGNGMGRAFGALGAFGGLLLALVLALAFAYLVPVALVRMALDGRIGSAFAFGEFVPVLTNGRYATGWLLALLVSLVVGAVASLLAAIPILGWIVTAIISFYAWMTVTYIYGTAYAAASEEIEGNQAEPADRGAAA